MQRWTTAACEGSAGRRCGTARSSAEPWRWSEASADESAAVVVSNGMTASQVDILPGGIIRPVGEGSNVLTMPMGKR